MPAGIYKQPVWAVLPVLLDEAQKLAHQNRNPRKRAAAFPRRFMSRLNRYPGGTVIPCGSSSFFQKI